jgi:hypothetical protein
MRKEGPVGGRLQGIIDRFLERTDVPEWLQRYAIEARVGAVQ